MATHGVVGGRSAVRRPDVIQTRSLTVTPTNIVVSQTPRVANFHLCSEIHLATRQLNVEKPSPVILLRGSQHGDSLQYFRLFFDTTLYPITLHSLCYVDKRHIIPIYNHLLQLLKLAFAKQPLKNLQCFSM
jgi:hypothetical protein